MTTGSATTFGSFGLSNGNSGTTSIKNGAGGTCQDAATSTNPNDSGDFVVIQGGATATANPVTDAAVPNGQGGGRFCGRFLNANNNGANTDTTICSRVAPFQLSVHTDGIEAAANNGAAQAATNELADGTAGTLAGPLGTIGFQLFFQQVACA